MSDDGKIAQRLKQGGVLSTTLLTLFMDDNIKLIWRETIGATVSSGSSASAVIQWITADEAATDHCCSDSWIWLITIAAYGGTNTMWRNAKSLYMGEGIILVHGNWVIEL